MESRARKDTIVKIIKVIGDLVLCVGWIAMLFACVPIMLRYPDLGYSGGRLRH